MKDPSYADEVDGWRTLSAPERHTRERVYYHSFHAIGQEHALVRLENAVGESRLSMRMEFPLRALNHLVQWKMMGEREYVLGLEPGTCFASGRADAFARGDIELIAAGATKAMDITLAFALDPSGTP